LHRNNLNRFKVKQESYAIAKMTARCALYTVSQKKVTHYI